MLSDKNLIEVSKVGSEIITESIDDKVFINAANRIFSIGGITHPLDNNNEYYRLDAFAKDNYSRANASLGVCTAGGTIRFITDAKTITVRIWLKNPITGMNHFTNRGVYGVDVYSGSGNNKKYAVAAMKTIADSTTFNQEDIHLTEDISEVSIYLPLYSGVEKLDIGFPKDSRIGSPPKRAIKSPLAFYGSSITQGGCVSRPANMYSHIICRELDADCLNLGFSGSAMGEQSIAHYLGQREISAFVMDYDFNSPSADTLRQTHAPFFDIFREHHPDIPVIFVTHPYFGVETEHNRQRKSVIRETYNKAVQKGDTKVYFVDSEDFFPLEMRDLFAVDYLHPNDLGNYYMAKAILPAVKQALKL